MTRISRKVSFFKRNHYLIFGCLWLFMSVTYYLSNDSTERSTSEWLFSIGYLIIAILYFFSAYKYRGKRTEYLEWDDENLNYQQSLGKLHSYKIENLISLTVAENNLVIKAQNAQGTMAPLKGYSDEDIRKLKSRFQKY
jgi:hypothetical protein